MNETNINRSRKAFKTSKFSPVWILSTLLVMSSTALALDCDDFNYSMHPQLESDAPELRLCDEAAGRVANPDLVFSSGVHLDQIDVMKAVRACQSANRLEPENHRITFQLGFSLQLAENHSEALSVLSLASEGGYAPAMERIGWAFSRGAGFQEREGRFSLVLQSSLWERSLGIELAGICLCTG